MTLGFWPEDSAWHRETNSELWMTGQSLVKTVVLCACEVIAYSDSTAVSANVRVPLVEAADSNHEEIRCGLMGRIWDLAKAIRQLVRSLGQVTLAMCAVFDPSSSGTVFFKMMSLHSEHLSPSLSSIGWRQHSVRFWYRSFSKTSPALTTTTLSSIWDPCVQARNDVSYVSRSCLDWTITLSGVLWETRETFDTAVDVSWSNHGLFHLPQHGEPCAGHLQDH